MSENGAGYRVLSLVILTMNNILLTGRPGVGKTTLIKKIVSEFQGKAGGFYTQEIRDHNRRTGFEIVTLSGMKGILASVTINSPFRVGKYGVNVKDLEEIGVREIERALEDEDLIVVDEIGKMELFAPRFQAVVLRALDSSKPFLTTITKSSIPFTNGIKKRDDVLLFEITERNRTNINLEIVELINNLIFNRR